jgi:dihydroorotase
LTDEPDRDSLEAWHEEAETMERLELTRPDDWHLHLRDGAGMEAVVGATAAVFARAVVMPNLVRPITTTAAAVAYRDRIRAALSPKYDFEPLMTLYLTDNTPIDEIRRCVDADVAAAKLYPAGATTNSDSGVTDVNRIDRVLGTMADVGLPLLVHGEVTSPDVDIFDREAVFLERILAPLVDRYPRLKVVVEHATTADAVMFVTGAREGVAATITPHHLLMNRNDLFVGGVRPHHYCLPVLKRERHRRALVEAATSGNPRFFLGTDSAPHPRNAKESSCGCAGMYSAPVALPLYAEVFGEAGALDRLEAFASFHGPDFYGLPRNPGRVVLERRSTTVPDSYPFGDDVVVPLRAGGRIPWAMQSDTSLL